MHTAEDYQAVIDTLVDDVAAHDWHLDVGIVGIKFLLPALSNAGRGWSLINQASKSSPKQTNKTNKLNKGKHMSNEQILINK
jgi:hypothetical protein